MAVVLDKAIFLHIPKTGGEWVRQVLWDAGLETERLDPGKQKHVDLVWFRQHSQYDRPFRFAFVRHPLSWYRSFWAFQELRKWRPIPEVSLHPSRRLPYLEFLAWVSLNRKGFLGRLYEKYTDGIEFVGRSEHLRCDLALALGLAGIEVPLRLIQIMPLINISLTLPGRSDKAMEDQVMEAEAEVCAKYGYA